MGLLPMAHTQPMQVGGLINTASNFGYPLSSGLMGAIAPNQGTDWSQVALQMAGNPHAGPFAPVSVPGPAQGAPGASIPSGGGGGLGQGLLGAMLGAVKNPSVVSNVGNAIKGLWGSAP